MSMMASSRPPPPNPLDLDLTIVSAKHIKNINWKNGDLKPFCVFWINPARRHYTKPDESGSTRPVWNERFTLPITVPLQEAVLSLEISHSIPSETTKPLVATLRVPLKDLTDHGDSTRIRTFELTRPSGRPQGKIRLKIGIIEQPVPVHDNNNNYHFAPPPPSYYYNSAPPPPPPPHHPRDYSGGYSPSPYPNFPPPPSPPPPSYNYPPAYPPYSSGYFYSSTPPPPLPPRPFFDRMGGGGGYGGPSAPVDYSPYDQRPKSVGKMGMGTGMGTGSGVGSVTGALGGLTLDEGSKYDKDKYSERLEKEYSYSARDDYSDYRGDF